MHLLPLAQVIIFLQGGRNIAAVDEKHPGFTIHPVEDHPKGRAAGAWDMVEDD
jgi:hypothetical protein